MYYNRNGKRISLIEWARLMKNPDYKIVRQTKLANKKWVSTVWMGLNHSFSKDTAPLIFETMVFPSKKNMLEVDCDRYSNETDAIEGHQRMVEKWQTQ